MGVKISRWSPAAVSVGGEEGALVATTLHHIEGAASEEVVRCNCPFERPKSLTEQQLDPIGDRDA